MESTQDVMKEIVMELPPLATETARLGAGIGFWLW